MDGAHSTYERPGTYKVLVGKPGGNETTWKTGRRWEDSIKMDLQDMGWRVMEWIYLVQDRVRWWALLHAVMYLLVP